MANPHKGQMEFVAEGKTYTLEFSHASLILLEEKLDKGIMKIMKEIDAWSREPENIRLGTIRSLLWAGLHKHHPDLTMEEATDLIGKIDGGLVGAIEVVGDGFAKAFSAPETKGTNPPQKGANGTGTSSGSSSSATASLPTPSGMSLPESTRST